MVKKIVILFYLIFTLGICALVPWEALTANGQATIPAGYDFIWKSPTYYYFSPDTARSIGQPTAAVNIFTQEVRLVIAGIDLKRITLELIGNTAFWGIVYILIITRPKEGDNIDE